MQAKRINSTYPKLRQAGFTLVELMVGMSIGLLATIIIVQVLSVFEAQRRSTSGTADAQTNGGIALYTIARELQQAGYPLFPATDSALECATLTIGGVADNHRRLSPVTITAGVSDVSSASDRLTIRYGSALMGGVPTPINAAPTGNDANVDTNLGCKVNDISLIVNGSTCAMSSVTGLVGTTKVTLANVTGANSGANLACMGPWNEVTYSINNGNLERNGIPSVAGIVNLQAQYGISTEPKSNQVTRWVNADGLTWSDKNDPLNPPITPTVINRNRIKAIRIAVVARNAKKEASDVTSPCSSIESANPTGLCAWEGTANAHAPEIDLSQGAQGDPEWKKYRYRVFETIIPLRNMIWAKETF